jgi:hypothetical protein
MHVHSNENCVVTMNELLNRNGDKAFIVDSTAGEEIAVLKDKGEDTLNAGCYTFYQGGKLRSYQFIIDEDTSDYAERYDTSGNITAIEGKPLTQSIITRISKDSFNVAMYFFALNKAYQQLHIKTSSNKEYAIDLVNDTSRYTNTKYALVGIHCKLENFVMIYWDIENKNTCNGSIRLLNDSIAIENISFRN